MKSTNGVGDLIGRSLDKIARVLSQTAVGIMVVTVLAQVFMRYFLKNPLVWGDELAKYSLVFMTFIGAAVALRDKQLAAMELITEKLPEKIKKMFVILVYIMEIVLLGFLFYYSINLLMEDSVKAQLSPALQVPMTWIYFSMPLGVGLMLIQAVLLIIDEIKGKDIGERRLES
ncbi:MAG: TRAP transporter small permease [Eubacteriales bacterium]